MPWFLDVSIRDIWVCPVHRRMLSCIRGLYPLDVGSLSPSVTNESSDIAKCDLEDKITTAENHWSTHAPELYHNSVYCFAGLSLWSAPTSLLLIIPALWELTSSESGKLARHQMWGHLLSLVTAEAVRIFHCLGPTCSIFEPCRSCLEQS